VIVINLNFYFFIFTYDVIVLFPFFQMVRIKNRYLLVECVWGPLRDMSMVEVPTSSHFYDATRNEIQTLFGVYGIGLLTTSLMVKYTNMETNLVLFRCLRDYSKMIWSALARITNIAGRDVLLRILHVSGTVRSCRKYALEHNKSILSLLKLAIDELTNDELQGEEGANESDEDNSITESSIPSLPNEFYQSLPPEPVKQTMQFKQKKNEERRKSTKKDKNRS
jgi:ribonuclease P/MRP protein subunit POP5